MAALFRNAYINKILEALEKWNNTIYRTIKMKPVNIRLSKNVYIPF